MCIRDRRYAALGQRGGVGVRQAARGDKQRAGAVSYTHLDVYKRQVLANAGAEHPGTQAGRDAADKVDRRGTGEVMEAELCQPCLLYTSRCVEETAGGPVVTPVAQLGSYVRIG